MNLKIYLHEEGDCFDVTNNDYKLTRDDAKAIHPVIGQIVSAITREEVVEALKALRLVAKNLGNANDYWKSYEYVIKSDIDIKISCLHMNSPSYIGHVALPGRLHSDSIEGMIAFADGSDRNKACTIF